MSIDLRYEKLGNYNLTELCIATYADKTMVGRFSIFEKNTLQRKKCLYSMNIFPQRNQGNA
jgi:hypothetical protein